MAPFGGVCGRAGPPGRKVLPQLIPRATQGRNTLGLGLRLLPLGQQRAGPGRVAAAWGPGRRESKAAMWAPLSSPGFKEVQTNPVPVPGGSSLLKAPACFPLLPPAPSPKVSSALSHLGAPQRSPDSWPCWGEPRLCQAEGRKGLGPSSHLCMFPPQAGLAAGG